MSSAHPHIAVIGAGVTGVTTAYELSRRGFSVTVFDRQRYAAMETSYANGGQLSVSNAEVWNSWRNVLKGMKWMLQADAPLSFSLSPSWHKYSWMAEFMGQIPNYAGNTQHTVKLGLMARQILRDTAAREGIGFDREDRGILHIYRNRSELEHGRKVNTLLAEAGLDRQEVSQLEIQRIEPALTGPLAGGFFTESDSSGDIHAFTTGLAQACERMGVTFRYGHQVDAVSRQSNGTVMVTYAGAKTQFDGMVLAAGVGSRALAHQLGERLNVYPVKGYSITVQLDDAKSQKAAPWVSLLDDGAKIVASRFGENRFRVAGTAEFVGFNRDIRQVRIDPLLRWCADLFPGMSTEHVTPWAGLRPMMPSMCPKVGRGRRSGVYFNTGHGHLGWTLSPATAHMVADTIARDHGMGDMIACAKAA